MSSERLPESKSTHSHRENNTVLTGQRTSIDAFRNALESYEEVKVHLHLAKILDSKTNAKVEKYRYVLDVRDDQGAVLQLQWGEDEFRDAVATLDRYFVIPVPLASILPHEPHDTRSVIALDRFSSYGNAGSDFRFDFEGAAVLHARLVDDALEFPQALQRYVVPEDQRYSFEKPYQESVTQSWIEAF